MHSEQQQRSDANAEDTALLHVVEETFETLSTALDRQRPDVTVREVGTVIQVGRSVAFVDGLPGVQSEELLRFPDNRLGMAFNLDADRIGVVMLDPSETIAAGDRARRTGRVTDIPVGDTLLGRVIDAAGRPLDGKGSIPASERLPIEREAPAIMVRAPVETPLQTGIKAIDALIPIGRGQRELILGDRQTGKTAIAVDTIINQKQYEVICVYCAIAQRPSAVAGVIADLHAREAMEYCTVIATTGDDPPGFQFIAPYAATSIAEHFMEQGRDVLIIYDDLTRHARAYRELSLLLRRPPGREAYPGDIFYIHSRLLERATHLRSDRGGGSLTALPIIETEAQNISAYIPTNLISITDGQIYLSPHLFQQGILPAIDVGKSVSRVGGKAQLAAYRTVAGDLKLSYAQFEELERFSRYGARLEKEKRRTLEHGRRIREVLKQAQYEPIPPGEQVAVLFAVTEGVMDDVPAEKVADAELAVRKAVTEQLGELIARIESGKELSDDDRKALLEVSRNVVGSASKKETDGNGRITAQQH
jgi:F-type H+-transporting ATPase subunit alpha